MMEMFSGFFIDKNLTLQKGHDFPKKKRKKRWNKKMLYGMWCIVESLNAKKKKINKIIHALIIFIFYSTILFLFVY